MKLNIYTMAIVACVIFGLRMHAIEPTKAAIVPHPKSYTETQGIFIVPEIITVAGDMGSSAVKYLDFYNLPNALSSESVLTALKDENLLPESYELEITPEGIKAVAADERGMMYAMETLSQIIDQAQDGQILAAHISDSPRMEYRGMMLDVVRCYMPIDELKKFVEIASRLKINKLHLHLTDDNGWRIQINKYPKLTDVGAWRVDRPELFPGRANPKEGEPTTYGGFYTQEEMHDLVKFAAEHNVEIIPEIEMPAHSIGAIASYPELACPVNDEFIGVLPGIGGKAASIIMCAGKDSTLQFVKDVLDEVIEIFPSEYIHLGGDEANKAKWEICPLCQKRIEDEHLEDCEALQGWFMDQIISYVASKGKKAIGWDEVTYGHPKEDIVIMGWQGTGAVAEKYARETGSRFIMTPARSTYLIRYQGPQWFEPFTYFGNITLKDAYQFEPVKSDWTDEMSDQLWGIQGSMWTEFCREPSDVQYMVFPRMIALADVAWREKGQQDWDNFLKATDNFLPRLTENGMTYARSMYNLQHTLTPTGEGEVEISVVNERPDAVIEIADNPEMINAKIYTGPFAVSTDGNYYMQAAAGDEKGKVLPLEVKFNQATGLLVEPDACTNGLAKVLTNGIRGSKRNSDFEWAGWYNATASFTLDLGEEKLISSVILGTLANANINVALPKSISLLLSSDNKDFDTIQTLSFDEKERFPLEAQVLDIDFDNIDKMARYIRIVAENGNPVPDGYPREGNSTWLYFDEIIVK